MWSRDQGIGVGHVTAVHAGTRLWIGGQHGVAYLEGDRFRMLETSGDELDGVYGLWEAGGDLWVYALSGVHRIDEAELDHAARNVGYQANYTRFDDVPVLADDPTQVRPLPALVSTRDGRLWFATGSGLVWVDPKRLATPPPAPQVILEEVFADGELLPPGRPMVVPALTERLTLRYTAPALGYPERLRFRFMLEGYDNTWQEAVDRREAAYTRLPPGEYRFQVVAANQGGSWSEPGAFADIIVGAAFYQTGTFQALLATAIIGLLWFAYRMRLRQVGHRLQLRLEERHRERERIARDLHDTLLQSVQGVLLKFHAATERLTSSDPARVALLGTLDRAEQVLEEGRRLIQGLRSVDAPADDLAGSLMDAGRELAAGDSPSLRATIEGNARPLDPMVYEELLHIGREALINAFRHARAAHIEVEIGYGRRSFHLRVRDDGIGMDAAHTTENGRADHFGIPGMYERASRVGATLKLWSRAGSGTEVDLQMPGTIAYRRRNPYSARRD
jgi:signal transduction histidine kinase